MTRIEAVSRAIRSGIPFLDSGVAMNHAGMSLSPKGALVSALLEDRACMSPPDLHEKTAHAAPKVRELYARMLNVSGDEIAITRHTAEGVNFVAQGYPWKKGDRILTVSVEYPSNVYPWWNVRDRGVEIVTVPEVGGRVDQDRFLDRIDETITMVVISHVEFASGFAFDLPRLASVCRERGVFLFVDIAQSIGVLPVDLALVDAAAWPTWKWLLGPVGMGGFHLKKRHLDSIRPLQVLELSEGLVGAEKKRAAVPMPSASPEKVSVSASVQCVFQLQ
jgi:selenocysteine lyase/cysteine desulfurase